MKFTLTLVAFLALHILSAQTLPRDIDSEWKVKEEDDRFIQINYSLEPLGEMKFFKITVRALVDGRPIKMESVGGDVGASIRAGKTKEILWQWDRDIVEISGELSFIVTQHYTDDAVITGPATTTTSQDNKSNLPLFGHPGIFLGVPAGAGLAVTGLLSSSSAKSDWDEETTRTSETYDPLNKKYKSGQILAAVGAATIVGGIVWYLVENSQFRKYTLNDNMKIEPGFVNTDLSLGGENTSNQLGIQFTYTF